MANQDATLTFTLLAKDLASSQIKGVSSALDGMSSKGKLVGTALKGASVVAGAGFAIMTKGALEAEKAQGDFMAATGKSREEAKQFVSSMDGLAGTAGAVGKSFEDIAETGTMVEQQFGTTGQKTQELTGHILEFAKVTEQDATGAAAGLEDTLSTYGQTAEDAAGFMDLLVASNQKFGTDAGPAALQTLRDMSPALQAVGGDLTDGVGFLNLFEEAGLDASAAATGLNKSIKELKPGQTLDDLIAQVGAIEDPLERAQKAAEIFGSKAGPKLAAAIKPGMTSLDDFKVSAEEAAGKTSKAADDMLTTGDRIQGFFDKLQAGAREVGQQFGPLLMGVSSLGTFAAPLIGKIPGMFTAIKAAMLPQAALAGAASGTAFAGGFSKVAGPLLGIGMVAALAAAAPQIDAEVRNIGNQAGRSFFSQFGDEQKGLLHDTIIDSAVDGIHTFMQAWHDAPWPLGYGPPPTPPPLPESWSSMLREQFTRENAQTGTVAADALGSNFVQSSGSWAPKVSSAWKAALEGQIAAAAGAVGRQASQQFAEGVLDNRGVAKSAWDQYKEDLKGAGNVMSEISWINGKLTGKRLADGLNSTDPLKRAAAQRTYNALKQRLDDLGALGYDTGTDAGTGVASGIDDSQSKALAEARQFMAKIAAILNKNFYVNASFTGSGFRDPDRDPTHKGPGGRALGGRAFEGVPIIVGERRPELFVPDRNGQIIPHVPVQPQGITLNLSFPSLVPYSGAQMQAAARALVPELTREMRRQRLLPAGSF